MAQGTVSKMSDAPVAGTEFKFREGQEVYVLLDTAEDLFEGRITHCGSYPSSTENVYRVELKKKVRSLYKESSLIGRRFGLFDKQGRMIEGKIFNNKQDAIDAEDDYGYDSLSAQYHAADGKPDNLTAETIEVWEINEAGVRIGEAISID